MMERQWEWFGMFQRSLSHRSVRSTSYVGDGDSKTFSHLLLHPIRVEKISQFQKLNVLDMLKKNGNSFTKTKTNELQTQWWEVDWRKGKR
ncbi:hypothetical protein TNCV_1678081 [Trichonephila clavipes]|nr:hypothetical protein TNCV_1678081 [Trichonephila clavipes]